MGDRTEIRKALLDNIYESIHKNTKHRIKQQLIQSKAPEILTHMALCTLYKGKGIRPSELSKKAGVNLRTLKNNIDKFIKAGIVIQWTNPKNEKHVEYYFNFNKDSNEMYDITKLFYDLLKEMDYDFENFFEELKKYNLQKISKIV